MNNGFKFIVETLHCNLCTALLLLILCCFHAPAFAGLNDGLVAYWSFDDCTAKDNSGNGHDGAVSGNVECINGVNNKKAMSFHADDDRINAIADSSFSSKTITLDLF